MRLLLLAGVLLLLLPCFAQPYRGSNNWSSWSSSNEDSSGTRYRRNNCRNDLDDVNCARLTRSNPRRCPDLAYRDIVGDVEIPINKGSKLFTDRLVRNTDASISFSNEDARYMTTRLINALGYLIDELPNSFNLVVVEGYKDINESAATLPLQYEGRGLLLASADQTISGLCHIYKAAITSGVDWIEYTGDDYVQLGVGNEECSKAVDVAFMVDSSGSVRVSDFTEALDFVESIIYSLDIRRDGSGARVAALSFSSSIDLQFDLDDYYDKNTITRKIRRLRYFGDGTRIDLGLQKLSTTVFQTRYGARSIQEGIPRVAFVMTDGKASRGFSNSAKNLKDLNVNVYAIGIGDGISVSELVEIASSPANHYVYTVEDFAHIQDILSESVAKICNTQAEVESGVSFSGTCRQDEIRYYKLSCSYLSKRIQVELTETNGRCSLYASNRVTNPGSYFINDVVRDETTTGSTRRCSVFLRNSTNIYVGVRGRATQSQYNVLTWERLFSGPFEVTIPNDISVGSPVVVASTDYSDSYGFQYGILAGNGQNYFSIHASSGQITLSKALDNIHQHYTLVVGAQEITNNCRRGRVKVIITIEQATNAEPPSFISPPSIITVPETTPISSEIITFSIEDNDIGINGKYYIEIAQQSEPYFTVAQTGVVSVIHRLNASLHTEHFVKIKATDKGDPPLSSLHELTVIVTDVNEPPIFYKACARQSLCRLSLPESTLSQYQIPDGKFSAYDYDLGNNAVLEYEVVSRGAPIEINTATGQLYTTQPFDRESEDRYTLSVVCHDKGSPSLSASTTVKLLITDINDETPTFNSSTFFFSILESERIGTVCGQVTATDRDLGVNSRFAYDIDPNIPFRIDINGMIKLNGGLDRETQSSYQFDVAAVDQGSPPLTGNAKIVISVLDANDNQPKFSMTSFVLNVWELTAANTLLKQFTATDQDLGRNAEITYAITEGNFEENTFSIVPDTGQVILASTLDAERISSYNLTIGARDNGLSFLEGFTRLVVTVEDANDNAPSFRRRRYSYYVFEDAPIGRLVGQVSARDRDVTPQTLTYAFEIEENAFTIDASTGEIHVNAALNYTITSRYNLDVLAVDSGTPQLTGTVKVFISIYQVSTDIATFSGDHFEISIPEDTRVFTKVARYVPVNNDGSPFITDFSFSQANMLFAINSNGVVSVIHELDYEAIMVHQVEIVRSDQVNVTLVIMITDVNDNQPVLSGYSNNYGVNEDANIGQELDTLTATDADSSAITNLTFSMTVFPDYRNRGSFDIHPQSGRIIVASSLNYERIKQYMLLVVVSDGGSPNPLQSEIQLTVTVSDVNDNSPEFSPSIYFASVREGVNPPVMITTVYARDADSGSNGEISYTIVSNSKTYTGCYLVHNSSRNYFTITNVEGTTSHPYNDTTQAHSLIRSKLIDQCSSRANLQEGTITITDSGSIATTVALDFETTSVLVLRIKAQDKGTVAQQRTGWVVVQVEDVNDSPPVFNPSSLSISLPEDTPTNLVICTVNVTDDDQFGIGNPQLTFSSSPSNLPFVLTGREVYLTGQIDADAGLSAVNLTVEAWDGNNLAVLIIFITIADVNDNYPVFSDTYHTNISEYTRPGSIMFICEATDNDISLFGAFSFSIISGNTNGTFVIDEHTGVVTTVKWLDYEQTNYYLLVIQATDGGGLSTTTSGTINVLNENDNAPEIQPPFAVTISDPSVVDVLTLSVVDRDTLYPQVLFTKETDVASSNGAHTLMVKAVDGQNSSLYSTAIIVVTITYSCTHVSFTIDRDTGVIMMYTLCNVTLIVPQQITSHSDVTFRCNAESNSDLMYCWWYEGRYRGCNTQPNDNTLVLYDITARHSGRYACHATNFARQRLNSYPDTVILVHGQADVIGPSNATVVTGTTTELYCAITSSLAYTTQWYHNNILLSNTSKTITQVDKLTVAIVQDTDAGNYHCVVTNVAGTTVSTKGWLTVCDCQEPFDGNFSLTVSRDIAVNSLVGSIQSAYQQYFRYLYYIVGADVNNTFVIDEQDGRIYIIRSIAADSRTEYNLIVFARDITGAYSGNTLVTLTVERQNLYTPTVVESTAIVHILETTLIGRNIFSLTVDDKDFGPDGEVNLTMIRSADSNYFRLHYTGDNYWILLTIYAPFNATEKDHYYLSFSVADSGNPPLTSSYNLTVIIDDVNAPPRFVDACALQNSCMFAANEDVPRMSTIGLILAYDIDKGSNAELTYIIDTQRLPFIVTDDGELVFVDSFDYENITGYSFDVVVSDNGNPPLYSKTVVRVNVMDVNDNPPLFTQSIFEFSIPENLLPNQNFGLLLARDGDSGSNSLLSYHVIGETDFGVDSSAKLYNTDILDYETKSFYNFSVIVRDGGTPPLSSTALVHIEILNINDNPPSFSQPSYNSNISECSSVGHLILVVTATDVDSSQLYYTIPSQNKFTMDSTTGRLSLSSSLDAESVISYQFRVIVKDEVGNSANSDQSTIQLNVINCNDIAPVFDRNSYNFTVSNSAGQGHIIGQVYATDSDRGMDEITYSILSGNINDVFGIDSITGQLIVNNLTASLGRAYYVLNIQVSDNGLPAPLYTQAEVTINIIDISNNLVLFFQQGVTIDVSEETYPSSPLASYDFEEAFRYFSTNQLTRLEIVTQSNNTFQLDPNTGILSLQTALNYRLAANYVIVIESEYASMVVSVTITVDVLDVNNNSPQFVPPGPYTVDLDENLLPMTTVFNVTAIDDDVGENSRITYRIVVSPASHSGDFIIDPTTGALIIARNLSYADVSSYTIQIFASDNGVSPFTTSTVIQLRINDVNNFVPNFVTSIFSTSISEAAIDGSVILTLSATDEDTGSNAVISYRMVMGSLKAYKGNAVLSLSNINFIVGVNTGLVTLQGHLDYEVESKYEFEVEAYNFGSSQLASAAVVVVHVADINDVRPRFNVSSYASNIPENSPVGTTLTQLYAYDEDSNTALTYSLFYHSIAAPIQIDINTGIVTISGEIDYERVQFISATATVSDGVFQDQLSLQLTIDNINDNSPVFSSTKCTGSLREDVLPPVSIVPCTANDGDSGVYGELTYSITDGNSDNTFAITSFTGVLSLNKPLDYETRSEHVMTVTVMDGGGRSAAVTAAVTVLNINDNPPQIFTQRSHSISSDTQIQITQLEAVDNDLENGIVPFISFTFITNSILFDRRSNMYSFLINVADINDANSNSTTELFVTLRFPCSVVTFAVEEYSGLLDMYTLCSVELFPFNDGQIGGNATLRATARGNTVWTYCWKLNGQYVTCTGQISSLYLYNLQTSNEGMYSVEVTNSAGSLESDAQLLRVFVPPAIVPLESVTALEGGSATLTCTVVSVAASEVVTVWYHDGRRLAHSQQTSVNGSYWTIPSVLLSDEGYYSCGVITPGFDIEIISDPAKVTIFRRNAVIEITLIINTFSFIDFCYEYSISQILNIIGNSTHYNPVLINNEPFGRLCERSICYPNPCQNGARCTPQGVGDFSCNCLPGWTGKTCNISVDYCRDFSPCLFQGVCVPLNTTINNFRCTCPLGHNGLYCELYSDSCAAPSCAGNQRCVPSQFTRSHFACVTRSYSVQIKRGAMLYKLLYGNQQWDLRSNINEAYQLEIILKYFLQNTGIPPGLITANRTTVLTNGVPCNVKFSDIHKLTISFDLVCPAGYPQLTSVEQEDICYLLMLSGYFEVCTPPDGETVEDVTPASMCNVTFYMKDDDGSPLPADDIIPILTGETALGFNDDNPYILLNAEKAPEPVTRNNSNTNSTSGVFDEVSNFPPWAGALMGIVMMIILLIIIIGIILCIIFCPCCSCCPCNKQRKRLIEKRYVISHLSATTSDMTLTSNMQTSESDYHVYGNAGARRNSELAEIEDEVLMWQNDDEDNIYEVPDGSDTTSGAINQETSKISSIQEEKQAQQKKISVISMLDEPVRSQETSKVSSIQEEKKARQKKISTVSMGGTVVTTHNPLFGMQMNKLNPSIGSVDNQTYGQRINVTEKHTMAESMFSDEIQRSADLFDDKKYVDVHKFEDHEEEYLEPWFFGNLNRTEAEEMLLDFGKVGGYLIRNSHTAPGDVCLSILATTGKDNKPPKFHHLLLSLNEQEMYHIKSLSDDEMSFSSLAELIAYYSVTDINFYDLSPPIMLMYPCPK